uniref:Uncharacterized protein n=1 Tax=Arundo donax TaxID=35708 RepID=A0A0A8YDB2_ARUDO
MAIFATVIFQIFQTAIFTTIMFTTAIFRIFQMAIIPTAIFFGSI